MFNIYAYNDEYDTVGRLYTAYPGGYRSRYAFIVTAPSNSSAKIILEVGHSEWLSSDTTSLMRKYLVEEEYAFHENQGEISPSLLSNCSVLIIGSAWDSFTQDELDAIYGYVNDGGGLLLAGVGWSWVGYHPESTISDYPMNRIAEIFDASFNDDVIVDPSDYTNQPSSPLFHSPYIVPHEITENVIEIGALDYIPSSINYSIGEALVLGDEDSYGVGASPYSSPGSTPPFLVAIEYNLGRVVLVGHEGIFHDNSIEEYDNSQLMRNIVKWLTRSNVSEPSFQEWNVTLSVAVAGYSALNATFGVKVGATGGFDAAAGDQVLPPGYAGVESYFYYPENPYSPVNLRKLFVSYLPVEYPAEWVLKVHTFTGASGETTLSWKASDIASIPSEYYVHLETPTGSVNMRENSQYTWTADEEFTYTFTIALTSEVEYTLQLKAGWNMVSLPVVPDDLTANAVMPSGLFYQLVTWTGTGYVAASDFEAGRGYWLLVLEDVNVTVTGIPVDEVTLTLSPGWSMIGGPNSVVQASEVFPGFYQLVTWTGTGYTPATVFEPGKGYWALVLAETQIQLPPT